MRRMGAPAVSKHRLAAGQQLFHLKLPGENLEITG
jgi:hypothetical protein